MQCKYKNLNPGDQTSMRALALLGQEILEILFLLLLILQEKIEKEEVEDYKNIF